jgi:hypothetical protein
MVLSLHMDHWQFNRVSAIERTSTTDALVFHDSVRIVFDLLILPRTPQHA